MKKILSSLILLFVSLSASAATFDVDPNILTADGLYEISRTDIPVGTFTDDWLFTVDADSSLEAFVQSIHSIRGGGVTFSSFAMYADDTMIVDGTITPQQLLPSFSQSTMATTYASLLPAVQYKLSLTGEARGTANHSNQLRSYGGWLQLTAIDPGTGGTGVAPVPEPETWAMMLVGLGIMGSAAARRRFK